MKEREREKERDTRERDRKSDKREIREIEIERGEHLKPPNWGRICRLKTLLLPGSTGARRVSGVCTSSLVTARSDSVSRSGL